MAAELESILRTSWRSRPTPPSFDLGTVPPDLVSELPSDYVALVQGFGGREGFLGTGYLRLYRLEQLTALNLAYEVPERLPHVIVFGSNGGGEAYGFTSTGAVVRVPFLPLNHENVLLVAPSFGGLLSDLARTGASPDSNPNSVGMEVHDKHPICLGGNPTDPSNKVLVPAAKHAELCRFWNKAYQDARRRS